MSDSVNALRSNAVMKLECVGYTELTIYIRSDGVDDTFDCTIASTVNASTYPTSYSSSDVKAHTSGNQNSGTALSDYTAVTYTGLNDNDMIYIVYTKTNMPPFGANPHVDRGFVLIPKQS